MTATPDHFPTATAGLPAARPADVLDLADGVRPVGEWVDALGRDYEVDREILARDLLEFAAELEAAGVL